MKAVAYI